jgi:hypothetical protein
MAVTYTSCPIFQRGWLWYRPLFGSRKSEGERETGSEQLSWTEDKYGEIQSQDIKQGRIKERYQVTIRNKFAALEN